MLPWKWPGGSISIKVQFIAQTGDIKTGTLTIGSDDPDEPQVQVSEVAEPPPPGQRPHPRRRHRVVDQERLQVAQVGRPGEGGTPLEVEREVTPLCAPEGARPMILNAVFHRHSSLCCLSNSSSASISGSTASDPMKPITTMRLRFMLYR